MDKGIRSEIIDSWDYFKFPNIPLELGSNKSRTLSSDFYDYQNTKLPRERLKVPKPPTESSTSLILKKTDTSRIFDNLLNNNNLRGRNQTVEASYNTEIEKPLIKVKVIPKIRTEIVNSSRIKKEGSIQKQIVNESRSIETKQVYLVIASGKTEKVYKISTKGNNKFFSDVPQNACLKDSKNFEQLFKCFSGNEMESKKGKKKLIQKKKNIEFQEKVFKECTCEGMTTREGTIKRDSRRYNEPRHEQNSNESFALSPNLEKKFQERLSKERPKLFESEQNGQNNEGPKSHVRITGRLGLNSDDKYIFKCAATVNDNPVQTEFTQGRDYNIFPISISPNNNEQLQGFQFRSAINQRVSPFPVQHREIGTYVIESDIYGKRSQGTQVNLDLSWVPDETSNYVTNTDKIVQCECIKETTVMRTTDNATFISDDREDLEPKDSQSPLVIISVYPNGQSKDNIRIKSNVNIADDSDTEERFPSPTIVSKNKPRYYALNKKLLSNSINSRSRSPPPAPTVKKTVTVKKNAKDVDIRDKGSRNRTRDPSPSNSTTRTRTNIEKKEASPHLEKGIRKIRSTSPSPVRNLPNKRTGSPVTRPKETKETNTVQQAKKAIVDEFTRNYTSNKHIKPRNQVGADSKVSDVTVNIDGENENYDLHFRKGKAGIGMSVWKTNKDDTRKKEKYDDANFLFTTEGSGSRRGSIPRKLTLDEDINRKNVMRASNLNVRDSIEISHRREDKNLENSTETKRMTNTAIPDCFNYELLVSSKHYRGDDCPISDPIKRDKEIRELLGIERNRYSPQTQQFPQDCAVLEKCGQASLQCLYQIPRENRSNASSGSVIMDTEISFCVHPISKKFMPHNSYLLPPRIYNQRTDTNFHKNLQNNNINNSSKNNDEKQNLTRREKSDNYLIITEDSDVSLSEVSFSSKNFERDLKNAEYYQNFILNRNIQLFYQLNQIVKRKPIILSRRQYAKLKKIILNIKNRQKGYNKRNMTIDKVRTRVKEDLILHYDKAIETDDVIKVSKQRLVDAQKDFWVLFNTNESNKRDNSKTSAVESSLEVHYTSMSYTRYFTFSHSDMGQHVHMPMKEYPKQKQSYSIETIYKGRRKPMTPNLGASGLSLYPEDKKNEAHLFKFFTKTEELKTKKHFLRRLLSCLAMSSTKASNKIPSVYLENELTANSSIDSYLINTSLGQMEMSSSIFDTSDDFHSNHSVLPSYKMRKGFLTSVRNFLTNRKS